SGRCGEASHGEKTEDLPDLAGLLRSGDGRSLHESGSGSVGRRQQSLPPGRGEGKRRSGRYRGGHGKARRRSQAPGWNRPTFQRTCQAAHRSWRRRTKESRPQVERPKGEEVFLSPRRQGRGTEGRSRLRTGTEAPRARTGEGR